MKPGLAASLAVAFALLLACRLGDSRCAAAAEPTLAEERAFQEAVARVEAAVVRVEPLALSTLAATGELSPGAGPSTGIVVAPERVLTTEFAVPGDVDAAVVVLADGGRRVGSVRGRDRSRGLVLLAVDNLPLPAPLEPAARTELVPGQWAIAVGRGWSSSQASVAVGIISATNRAWGKAVQTDAAASPQNYGGPLVDVRGRVIGVLAPLPADTAGMVDGTQLYDAGIGFAIPWEDVLTSLSRLERGDSLAAGILGIGYRSRDAINGEPLVASVQPGSPAAEAGLQPGDRLRAIDGRRIARIADARHAIGPRYAGDTVVIEVERIEAGAPNAKQLSLEATLVEQLPPWRRAVLGLATTSAGTPGADGITIDWILPAGAADQAGLQPFDTLTAIEIGENPATPLAGAEALAGLLAGSPPGTRVRLEYTRNTQSSDVELQTMPPPVEVPAVGILASDEASDPLAGPIDSARVVRLNAAEVAEPAIAVIPPGSGPMGVLIWFPPPHGPVDDAEAAPWKALAVRYGVAVVLPGSAGPAAWSRDDIQTVTRSLAVLHARRPIDASRIGLAGSGAGGVFAWLVAERLGNATRGVALVGSGLPQLATVTEATPERHWWVLLGPGMDDAARLRIEADRRRLAAAGHAAGLLPVDTSDGPPAELLCRWVSILGLL
jgi:serine protease Do